MVQKFHIKGATMNVLETIISKVMPWAVKPKQAPAQTASATKPVPAPLTQKATPLAPHENVNVEEILRGMEARSSQKLDWQHSIVDLMKMLDMNSDIASRKQLAKELNYTGNMSDSATMNIWLHKQVMKKFEENGGKIPTAMKH